MSPAPSTSSPAPAAPPLRRGWPAWKAAVAGGIAVAVALLLLLAAFPSPTPPGSPPGPAVRAVVAGPSGPAVPLSGGFLGVNLRADGGPLDAAAAAAVNATPVRLVRWPGGGLADRLDPLGDGGQGVIYAENGTASVAPISTAAFVAWCERISCRSIVTLPGEIDEPSYAAAIVTFVETDLHFRPTYWEIGNEPGLWNRFGIPWANWSTAANVSVTPSAYAVVVQSYVAAIRAVDPAAAIIGLGGVGLSGVGETTWIRDTVSRNGPNLSAIAIHVYPGGALSGPLPEAAWTASLDGNAGLGHRMASDLAAMRAACAACALSLLVDEYGAATNVTGRDGLAGGYLAEYLAAMIAQALALPVASLDYFVFQLGTYGAWFDMAGNPSPSYLLYAALGRYLGAFAAPWNVSAPLPGLLAAGGGASAGSLPNLLLVNTNATVSFSVDLGRSYPNASRGIAWIWNGAAAAPATGPVGSAAAAAFQVPPASVVLLSGIGVWQPPAAPAAAGRTALLGALPVGERPDPVVVAAAAGATPATAARLPSRTAPASARREPIGSRKPSGSGPPRVPLPKGAGRFRRRNVL